MLEALEDKGSLLQAEMRILKKLRMRSAGTVARMETALGVERRELDKIDVAITQVRNKILENNSLIDALQPEPNYETAQMIDTSGVGSEEVMGMIGG